MPLAFEECIFCIRNVTAVWKSRILQKKIYMFALFLEPLCFAALLICMSRDEFPSRKSSVRVATFSFFNGWSLLLKFTSYWIMLFVLHQRFIFNNRRIASGAFTFLRRCFHDTGGCIGVNSRRCLLAPAGQFLVASCKQIHAGLREIINRSELA